MSGAGASSSLSLASSLVTMVRLVSTNFCTLMNFVSVAVSSPAEKIQEEGLHHH